MRVILGNRQLDELLDSIQSTLFVDEPTDTTLAANYLMRATQALLGSDDGECSVFDGSVLESLELIINEFLASMDMRFANVALFCEYFDPYNFFLMLEITDGCPRQSQYPRHCELLAVRENAVFNQNRF